jgi:fluoroquinolone resistance protein
LSNARVRGARFRDVVFRSCKLLGIPWIQADDLINPDFEDCKLDFSNFAALKLKKTRFFRCGLRDVDFSQAELTESDFREADFLNARFSGSNLVKCDFRGSLNYVISPVENKVKGARFSMPEALGLLSGFGIVLDL